MHELGLAMELVRQIEAVMRREHAERAVRVNVARGALCGVERDPFELAFPLAAEGTPAEGAELVIRDVPTRLECGDCGRLSVPEFPFMACPACGSGHVDAIEGCDLLVESVEVL